MFKGNGSAGEPNYPTQWALNPASYQNLSNEQVDWAALAQQWIIMKEAAPPTSAPPPASTKNLAEGGEAPMDVENDKEEEPAVQWNDRSSSSWEWQQQWGWGNQWNGPSGVPPPKEPLLPTPFAPYVPEDSENSRFPTSAYDTVPPGEFSGGYWTAAGANRAKQQATKYRVPFTHKAQEESKQDASPVEEPVLSDAKRRQLPAWIREGLEKMEREKQKQLDRERENQRKEEFNERIKLDVQDTLQILKSTVTEQKSKFESDDESENENKRTLTPDIIPLTYEQKMMKVRKIMTEILLNVTTKDIAAICQEEIQRYRSKTKASTAGQLPPAGANISGALGLGIYGGSGSSSDDDSDSNHDSGDSEAQLKDTIRRRKAEFSQIEREIEDKLSKQPDSRGASPEVTGNNDSQVDARSSGEVTTPKHRQRKKTPPPMASSDSDSSSSSSNYKKRKSRRSSSSSSDKKKKDRDRRARSSSDDRTPERRKYSRKRGRHRESEKRRSRSRTRSRSRRKRSEDRRRRSRSRRRSRTRSRSRSRSKSHNRSSNRRRRSYSNSRGKRY